MLFEQVARRLIDIEEHEYALATDEVPYVASCQSRFNNPEIIAVMGDVVRRMRLLKGTRAATCRTGFDADLKALGRATSARSALSWATWCDACGCSKAPGRPAAEKGFDADLQALGSATSDEFMEAMRIAGPSKSLRPSSSRPDMPSKIQTCSPDFAVEHLKRPGMPNRRSQEPNADARQI